MNTLKTLFCTILITMTSLAMAQQKTADQVMKHVIDNLKKHNNVEIGIDYKIINKAQGINENRNGTVTIQGNAYKIVLPEQQVTSNGSSIWTYMPNNEEVLITEDDGSMSPMKLLETYKHHITKFASSDKGRGLRTIEIKNSENHAERITIIVDESKNEIKSFTIVDAENNSHVITIKEYSFDKKLSGDFFTLTEKEHPDAEFIDMR